jgi:hypothetical protein
LPKLKTKPLSRDAKAARGPRPTNAVIIKVPKKETNLVGQDITTVRVVGRPATYKPEFAAQAKKLCVFGATDADLADFFGVAWRTISKWAVQHPEFGHALKEGKEARDSRIERRLAEKAMGYTVDAIKIIPPSAANAKTIVVEYQEHIPPDTTAAIFWLKNRKPKEWRDSQQMEHSGSMTVQIGKEYDKV